MDILKRINQMRLDRNWSIYRLSVESGIAQSTLSNMFNRETLPSITTLECLCHAFGITVADFFAEDKSNSLSEAEQELLRLYRTAPGEAQKSILALLRVLSEKH